MSLSNIKKPVIILGAGGHAKVLIEALRQSSHKIIGVTDPDKTKGSEYFGENVLGNDSAILEYSTEDIELVNGIGMLPENNLRNELNAKMESEGYFFSQVIHPSSIIASTVFIENGVQIMAGVVIQPDVRIERGTIINTSTSIDHDCFIGKDSHLAPNVTVCGECNIGDGVFIGAGSVIIPEITIGANAVIGAGSLVLKDIVEGSAFYNRRKN